jgi:hypothetical protein
MRKPAGVLKRYGSRAVRRTVIDEQQFQIFELLREHALDRFIQKAFCVKKNRNNRNTRNPAIFRRITIEDR